MLAGHLARSLANPLARQLVAAPSGLDTSTHDYIAQIRATGVTVTSTQQNAIDDFIVAEKAASRWDGHKRIYLPIWLNAAANAICMKTCTSGTFVNSPTHGAGFVQGNGSTSYFDTGVNWKSLGLSEADATIGTINYTRNGSANQTSIGVGDTGATAIRVGSQNSAILPLCAWAGTGIVRGAIGTSGIQMASRKSGATTMIRRAAGGITSDTNAGAVTGTVINRSILVMANGVAGSVTQPSTAQIGGAYIGAGMDLAALTAFSLNWETLWEACTGLTLPA